MTSARFPVLRRTALVPLSSGAPAAHLQVSLVMIRPRLALTATLCLAALSLTRTIGRGETGGILVDDRLTGSLQLTLHAYHAIDGVDFVTPRMGYVSVSSWLPSTNPPVNALLRTRDGGRSWQPVARGVSLTSLSFQSPTRGFALQSYHLLVWTGDGGRHWRLIHRFPLSRERPVAFQLLRFVNPRDGWFVDDGRLERTTDAGRRWQPLPWHFQGNRVSETLTTISFVSPAIGFALCVAGPWPAAVDLYRTGDAGMHWRRVSTVDREAPEAYLLDFLSARTGVLATEYNTLQFTTDGGRTFHTRHLAYPLVSAFWLSSSTGYLVLDLDTLVRTTDGGRHLLTVYPESRPGGVMAFRSPRVGVGGGDYGNFDVLLATEDAGRTWRPAGRLPYGAIYQIVPRPHHALVVLTLGPDGYLNLLVSADDGRRWRWLHRFSGTDGHLWIKGRNWFVSTEMVYPQDRSVIYRSRDGGHTWQTLLAGSTVWAPEFTSGLEGWALAQTSYRLARPAGPFIFHTSDGGDRWRKIRVHVPGIDLTDIAVLGNRYIWLAGNVCTEEQCDAALLRTRDGGKHWELITLPTALYYYLSMTFLDANLGYLNDRGVIYVTRDGGVHWQLATAWNPFPTLMTY